MIQFLKWNGQVLLDDVLECYCDVLKDLFLLLFFWLKLCKVSKVVGVVLLLVLVIGVLVWLDLVYKCECFVIVIGEWCDVILVDGSQFLFDSGSQIEVSWYLFSCWVVLCVGQVFFEVFLVCYWCFVVFVGLIDICVFGIWFNVCCLDDDVCVILECGWVEVGILVMV